jgi:hypothetical protein
VGNIPELLLVRSKPVLVMFSLAMIGRVDDGLLFTVADGIAIGWRWGGFQRIAQADQYTVTVLLKQ